MNRVKWFSKSEHDGIDRIDVEGGMAAAEEEEEEREKAEWYSHGYSFSSSERVNVTSYRMDRGERER